MPLALPSLGNVVTAAWRTARRFPLSLLAGVVAAAASILAMDDVGPDALHERLLTASVLGLPLFTAVTVAAERKANRHMAQLGGAVAALAVLALFYAGWAGWSDPVRGMRFAQLLIGFVLLATFLPFLADDRPNAFWQYNRALLERAVFAAITAIVLFVGLAIALAALDKLFGVDVPDSAYGRLWVVVVFVITTWFYLGGIPDDLGALEDRHDYPGVLRVFAQYTLVPLVTMYLVILTVYLAKIIVTWDWPSGWVGMLVSGVAVAGVFTLALVHPLAEDPDQKWIATFSRWFWPVVLPAIVMLWLALYQRIAQYGITPPRYFLGVGSLWFAAVAVYYAVTRSRRIRLIPVSLCAVALLAFAGPWGAYGVAERSQTSRLHALLEQHGMLADGQVRAATVTVPAEAAREISAVLRYLVQTHGTRAIAAWFTDAARADLALDADPAVDYETRDVRVRRIVRTLGVPYMEAGRDDEGVARFNYQAAKHDVLDVSGWDVLVRLDETADSAATARADTTLAALTLGAERTIRVTGVGEPLLIPLDSVIAAARRSPATGWKRVVPAGLLRTTASGAGIEALVALRTLNLTDSAGVTTVTFAGGDVLLRGPALRRGGSAPPR